MKRYDETVLNSFSLDCNSIDRVLGPSKNPIFIVDRSYRICYINEAAQKLTFCNRDVIGLSTYDVFLDWSSDPNYSIISRCMITGKPVLEELVRWVSITGERRLSVSSAYPLVYQGEVVAIIEYTEPLVDLDNKIKARLIENAGTMQIHEEKLPEQKASLYSVDDIIGESPAISELRNSISMTANSRSNVLIFGETGTGKEMVAQAVHSYSSDSSDRPFVAQNCAAIPENLLESLLFGTNKGAFTGAIQMPGLFELANGGTLFLDELNSMPIGLQAKLLRALQEKKVRRLGSSKEVDVDVRLIAAINERPDVLISEGRLREDLFFRVGVLYIKIPPLRERKEDIPVLLMHFINYFNRFCNKKVVGFDNKCMDFFINYDWPGNVRELRNIVERAVSLATDKVVCFEQHKLMPYAVQSNPVLDQKGKKCTTDRATDLIPGWQQPLRDTIKAVEESVIRESLVFCNGSIAKAARLLDIPYQTMNNKMNQYGLRSYAESLRRLYKQYIFCTVFKVNILVFFTPEMS